MTGLIMDLKAMPDAQLEQLLQDAQAELQRRSLLRTAPQQADQLARRVLAAEGLERGGEWAQALMGYPKGWTVLHDGAEWESLIDHNIWMPGDPDDPQSYRWWKNLSDTLPDGEWDPNGHTYQIGDEVTYEGARYRCLQTHESQPGWSPTAVPALWQLITP